jgi:hypothetical protein
MNGSYRGVSFKPLNREDWGQLGLAGTMGWGRGGLIHELIGCQQLQGFWKENIPGGKSFRCKCSLPPSFLIIFHLLSFFTFSQINFLSMVT